MLRHARVAAALCIMMVGVPGCSDNDRCGPFDPAQPVNPIVLIETSMGDITAELYAREAPITVGNFLQYVYDDFYDGLIFHRVVRNFVIQGGQYDPELQERPARDPIRCEADNGILNRRGTISMARSYVIDSATCQFFINVTDNKNLDHDARHYGYAVFGRVIAGMEVIDSINTVETESVSEFQHVPVEPIIITDIRRL